MDIEVAYATPEKQSIVKLRIPAGTTAAEAIDQSGIRELYSGIESEPQVGIFSKKVSLDYELKAGDRVEVYRPLIADPKEVRRRKAEEQKSKARDTAKNRQLN
jgi:putative ubiquitin-RnfH superfamily antitoxin RatB of RatAB toxin-antitoxin module